MESEEKTDRDPLARKNEQQSDYLQPVWPLTQFFPVCWFTVTHVLPSGISVGAKSKTVTTIVCVT